MKVSVLTPAFGERRFIGGCVEQFKGFPIDKHLVLCSITPWFGDESPDDSAAVAARAGAWVLQKKWTDEDRQRLDGMELLKDSDWILFVDADEFYTKEGISTALRVLRDAPEDVSIFRSFGMLTYWRNWDTVIDPTEFNPIMAFRPRAAESLVHIRDFDGQNEVNMPKEVMLHHLAYARTNKEVLRKIRSWGHSEEVVGDWYEKKWLGWTKDTTNFHPCQPHLWTAVKRSPLPKEIRDIILYARKEYL